MLAPVGRLCLHKYKAVLISLPGDLCCLCDKFKTLNAVLHSQLALNKNSLYAEVKRQLFSPASISSIHTDAHKLSQCQYRIDIPVIMPMGCFNHCAEHAHDRTPSANSLTDYVTISWLSWSSGFWHRAITQVDIDFSEKNTSSLFRVQN